MAAKRVDQIAGHLNYPKGMLAGQTAIITGSGQGIGAEAARLFAKEGAKVVVADVDASKLIQHGSQLTIGTDPPCSRLDVVLETRIYCFPSIYAI